MGDVVSVAGLLYLLQGSVDFKIHYSTFIAYTRLSVVPGQKTNFVLV